MRLPRRFTNYVLPGLTQEQNDVYASNLRELELPNPFIRYYLTADTTVASGVEERITWGSVSTFFPQQSFSTNSTGTAPNVPFDALWNIQAHGGWNTEASGTRRVLILSVVRGATTYQVARQDLGAVINTGFSVSATIPLFGTDRIVVDAVSDSTVAASLLGGDGNTWLSFSGVGIRST